MKQILFIFALVACTLGAMAQTGTQKNQKTTKYEVVDTDFFFEEEIDIQQTSQTAPPPPPPAPQVNEESEEDVIFMVVEHMPEFPGGQQALFKYLADSVKYPEEAQKMGIQGRVICQFVINNDGSIVDVAIVRSSGDPSLDNEAIRVIKSMPKWKPGTHRGKPVRVKYTVPVNFRLE